MSQKSEEQKNYHIIKYNQLDSEKKRIFKQSFNTISQHKQHPQQRPQQKKKKTN